jgi:hypothetical protein
MGNERGRHLIPGKEQLMHLTHLVLTVANIDATIDFIPV